MAHEEKDGVGATDNPPQPNIEPVAAMTLLGMAAGLYVSAKLFKWWRTDHNRTRDAAQRHSLDARITENKEGMWVQQYRALRQQRAAEMERWRQVMKDQPKWHQMPEDREQTRELELRRRLQMDRELEIRKKKESERNTSIPSSTPKTRS